MEIKINFKIVVVVIIAVILLFFVFSSFYTVGETENAVVTTFGKYTSTQTAGLQFKLPYPIQDCKKVDMTTRKMVLGYTETDDYFYSNSMSNSTYNAVSDLADSKMISGDYNVVSVDFFLEWKVSDPKKYLYNSINPQLIFKNIARAAARDIIGSKNVDEILTTGKSLIQSEIKDIILKKLEELDLGIQLLDVKIQDAEPPTIEVIMAFKAVETAKQEKDTTINKAKAYENSVIPDAEAQADKIIKDAEGYKEQRINEATGAAGRFEAMYNEYRLNSEITRKRMYLEMIEDVLPGIDVYIDAQSGGSIQKLLPIESFIDSNNTGGGNNG